MFLFQKWLGSPFPEDVRAGDSWSTDSSFSSLLVKLSQVFESALLHSILKLAVIPVACASFQSTFFETALFEQPPLSVMTLCDLPSLWGVSMFIFWIIAKSAVFPIIVVSKNKRYPQCILYGWSFIETHLYLRYQTHSVTYCLIIVIDKIPENIEIFCQYRTSLLPKVI